MHDFIINNAALIDGSDTYAYIGSLSVIDGRISGIWPCAKAPVPAKRAYDARGCTLCPGLIDTHTHSDISIFRNGCQPSSITQGVTSEIIGQCGLSYAPLGGKNLRDFAIYMCGINGPLNDKMLDFSSARNYIRHFEGKIGVNLAWLVPHGAIRMAVAGFSNRFLTSNEMENAKGLVRESMEQGAVGMSTGLSYFPGAYCNTDELVELCRVIARFEGVYATHLRTVFIGKPFDAVEEALEIARRSGVKLHFSHYRTGVQTLGQTDRIMEKIDAAVSDGLDITLELYPYPYGASFAVMYLPAWANEDGPDAILARLEDDNKRAAIGAYIEAEFGHLDPVVSYAGVNTSYEGKSFSLISQEMGLPYGQAVAELLRSQKLAVGCHEGDPKLDSVLQTRFEKDLFELLERSYYMVGSDAVHVGSYPHPRAFGCFAKLLRLARQYNFPLETLINRMCYLPARRFGLHERGLLKEGYAADVVLFDPTVVTDTASTKAPRSPAKGLYMTFVNGVAALENGELTGSLTGQFLKKGE